jgi:hypothetical protein
MTSTSASVHPSALPLIRPAWTPVTIGLMVAGFIVFAPLGFLMLAYIIWGERFHAWRDGKASFRDAMNAEFKGSGFKSRWSRDCGPRTETGDFACGFSTSKRTGNVAFDDWRDGELERLAQERRKLEALRDEFDAYARELRRAKDQQEFDRFMSERAAARDASADADAGPAGDAGAKAKRKPAVKDDE